ncbi:MAG: hypothetical protein M1837_003543 [Sclerophora amabilis]|nr:MAG: hypothetical protein M1837_003543 [Sclerophora amabilis]
MPTRTTTAEAVELDYFGANSPPRTLAQDVRLAREFIGQHDARRRRVVLVTSGGTTVPLENQTVRFIDNFSAGTRGATSAEYFLEADYAVIFLHRQHSRLPYSRHYSHSTNCFLDFLRQGEDGSVQATEEWREEMSAVLAEYTRAKENNMLLLLPFTTITEYLWELREIATVMRPLGPRGLFYLAAAVSDFFIPQDRMAEHKIQSSDPADRSRGEHKIQSSDTVERSREGESNITKEDVNTTTNTTTTTTEPQRGGQRSAAEPAPSKKLVIDLDPVPKFLKRLVDGWAPEGMIVSFKLETDPAILVSKARYALDRYAHHLVIGNLLSTRKWEVVFVSRGPGPGPGPAREGGPQWERERWIRVPSHRRTKSTSGVEGLVGLAALSGRDPTSTSSTTDHVDDDDKDGADEEQESAHEVPSEGEPLMEIESLIVPEVARLHGEFIDASERIKS